VAPWWWFPCKPKHVGVVLLILKCFNNSTFFNVVCVSWLLKCWILMHGVTMQFITKLVVTFRNFISAPKAAHFAHTVYWCVPYGYQNQRNFSMSSDWYFLRKHSVLYEVRTESLYTIKIHFILQVTEIPLNVSNLILI